MAHPFKSVEQRAIKKFAKDYGFNIDKPRKKGLLGKIGNALWKRRNYDIDNLQNMYNKRYDQQNTQLLKADEKSAKFLDKNGKNSGYRTSSRMHGISKPGGKGFFGGKGGKVAMMAGLVGLGAVISNMFSGGHQSNSQLYNPNPQPQYYS